MIIIRVTNLTHLTSPIFPGSSFIQVFFSETKVWCPAISEYLSCLYQQLEAVLSILK